MKQHPNASNNRVLECRQRRSNHQHEKEQEKLERKYSLESTDHRKSEISAPR